MVQTQPIFFEDSDPIDIVETLAADHAWEFERVADDQIAMSVEGQWRTYSLTLALSPCDETLRLVATFDIKPPEARLTDLHAAVNGANDQCWLGAFTYWPEAGLMVYRYALSLAGGQSAASEQIERMVEAALRNAERFYPAFQLVCWGGRTPQDALKIAIAEAYGTA